MSDVDPTVSGEVLPMQLFQRGLETSLMAMGDVFGLGAKVQYELQPSDDEADIAVPAKLVFGEKGEPIIRVHQEAFDDYASELTARYHNVTMQDLATIHIGATVIPHIVVSSIDPRHKTAVDKMYLHMADTDVLNEALADSLLELGEGESIARLAFFKYDEDHILLLNRLRLAAGVLAYHESIATSPPLAVRDSVDFGGRLAAAFKAELHDLPQQLEVYTRAANAFGVFDEHIIEQQFLDRVSPVELAIAFPMLPEELSVIAKWAHQN